MHGLDRDLQEAGRRCPDNGHTYYTLEGQHLLDPRDAAALPAQELLAWHSEAVFLAG